MSGENGPTPWHVELPLLTSLNENEGELCQSRVGCLLSLKEAAEGQVRRGQVLRRAQLKHISTQENRF